MRKSATKAISRIRLGTLHRRLTALLAVGAAAALLILVGFSGTPAALAGSSQPPVGLGTAASFAVLAGTQVTNTGPSIVSGDLGVNPGTSITGFPPGTVVNGTQYTAGAIALQAQKDSTAAYTDAAGRTPSTAVLADLGGQTVVPGVYKSSSTLGLTGTLILNAQNNPNAVFIFQAVSSLITASSSVVKLINGAQACNVFWQVGSSATLGTNSTFVGTILASTSASLNTGATVAGRVLVQTGMVSLESNTITVPTCSTTTTTKPTTSTSTSISTAPSHGSITLGSSVRDNVTVTGSTAGGTPAGSVQFYECADATTCVPSSGTALTPAETLVGGAATSPFVTPTAAGTYCFAAVYSPTGSTYLGSSETGSAANGECFTVTTATVTPPVAKPVVIPSTHTGQPWSGWLYWVLVAVTGAAGLGLTIGQVYRRRVRGRTAI